MVRKSDSNRLSMEFFKKGYALQLKGQLDKAANYFKESIRYKPSAEAYTYLGWIYSIKGHYEKAIENCHKAIEVNPDFGNPYNDIGAYLIQLKKYDEAISWLKKALKAPKYDNYCYPLLNLGYVFEKKGEWLKAIKYYEKSIKENPKYKPSQTALDRLRGKFN